MILARVLEELSALGSRAVDASTPAEIAIVIDESIGPPLDGIVCSADSGLRFCEGGRVFRRQIERSTYSVIVRFENSDASLQRLWLELLDSEDGPVARVFIRSEVDHVPPGLTTECPVPGFIAASGSLRLSSNDIRSPDLHGSLEVVDAEGVSVSVEF